ncbi:glycolipid translocation protein NDAI_0B02940 [Naumovozyma dairenensis CBS 421]|uniref:Man(5)GlcNAc(2)-PP-dolichol translocation protein RFT1 n=1 Tax=Naumovozyma dairenensis (strain ATCC 10597 / BCRC 20456 / CBS 421 / NBRC 0211 / NRRL Y-12639) TaxID=1071378 RepID=G0W6B8_NAUDC|nr:hypothetical protein NDAI_0B02940 [Naumovozyma dairenensis CBS 421]CCD23329.1 hypothetical protein NDAI_0B02940 [Naumovozyma dairenensis CBS 421]
MDEKDSTTTINLPTSSDQILEKSTKGATFLMLGQLFTKLITFFLNSLLVRFLSPRIFGITAFLEFIVNTVLFFSREAIRLSTLRITEDHTTSSVEKTKNSQILQTAVNFAYIPFVIGVPLSIVLTTWQYKNINGYFINLPFFQVSILLIWISIIVELLSEPFFIINQFMLNYSSRSRIESLAITMGCITNFIIVVSFEKNWWNPILKSMIHHNNELMDQEEFMEVSREGIAILAFAVGKLVHSLILLLCYYWDYLMNFHETKTFSLKLTKIYNENKSTMTKNYYYFQNDILEHFKKVYFQLCFKHLLTEGDKLIINSLCTVEEQGIYSLLSNYGSLVTRLLFAPIEESLRLFLARLLSNRTAKNLKLSMQVLINLTKFYFYLSLLIVIFGPVNSSFLLQFLIGSKWSTTSVLDTIRVYCFYIPFLSLNGIFEAFFQSTATGDQILKHSYFMMVFSGVFLLNCWILIEFLNLSINGLIYGNIFNMILRITYCSWFIINFYKKLYNSEENISTSSMKDSTLVKDKGSIFVNFRNFRVVIIVGLCISTFNWIMIGHVKNFHQLFINIVLALILFITILLQERTILKGLLRRRKVDESKEV